MLTMISGITSHYNPIKDFTGLPIRACHFLHAELGYRTQLDVYVGREVRQKWQARIGKPVLASPYWQARNQNVVPN